VKQLERTMQSDP